MELRARIKDSKYRQYGDTFAGMGLAKQEFRVVSQKPGQVVVHQDDLVSPPKDEDFTIREDFVEFLDS